MKNNWRNSLRLMLRHEGGFSDNPADPGGATMRGVTLATFKEVFGSFKTKDNLRAITEIEISHIYKQKYWDKCNCDSLPSGLDYAVFDAVVNSGPRRAAKWLQKLAGVTQDGIIGKISLGAVAQQEDLINRYCLLRLKYMQKLGIWKTFGKGWSARVLEVNQTATKMESK